MDIGTLKRILLVDDEPSGADVLARLLRRAGYQVDIAGTTAAALAAAACSPFDLVITDIHLPDRPGTELMRDLTARHSLRGIAISGWAPEDLTPEDVSLFAAYLVKPVVLDHLLKVVQQVLEMG